MRQPRLGDGRDQVGIAHHPRGVGGVEIDPLTRIAAPPCIAGEDGAEALLLGIDPVAIGVE